MNTKCAIFISLLVVNIMITFASTLYSPPAKLIGAQLDSSASLNRFGILSAGINAYNSAAEFGPVMIGRASVIGPAPNVTIDVPSTDILPLTENVTHNEYGNNLIRNGIKVVLKDATLFSTLTEKNVNYIQVSFGPIWTGNARSNHNGVVWNDGFREYYAFLRPDQLVLFTPERGEIAWAEAAYNIGQWNTIQVVYTDNVINIILNGVNKIQEEAPAMEANVPNACLWMPPCTTP